MSAADLERLNAALKDGEKSLGDLRRQDGIEPTVIGKLVQAHPDRFVSFDKNGRPFIRLRGQLSALDSKIFGILKGSRAGLSLPRLWSSNKVRTEDSKSFAERFSDVAVIVSKKTREGKQREFLMLKREVPAQLEKPEPSPQDARGAPETVQEVETAAAASNTPRNDPAKPATPPPLDSEMAATAALLFYTS